MTEVASLDVRIGAQTGDLERGLRNANQQTNDFARRAGAAMRRAAAGIAGAGLVITGAAVRSAVAWESSFTDVRKTVDGTPEELSALEDAIRSMATSDILGSLDNAHSELAGIAALAGQLGVETSSIDEFTESIAALTVASDLSGEQAATFAARFANVTGLNIETDIDNLANTIVFLGNNMAATETDITNFASRLSSLSVFDFSVEDILGYSAALASLDLSPELGSSNLIRTVTDMTNAVANGTPDLQAFASAAGMTSDEFSALASADPSAGLDAFIEGLSNMDIDEQLATLQSLNITSSEQQRVLLTMASGYDTVTEAVEMSNDAYENSNAAMEEAAAKANTTQGAVSRMRNAFNEAGINLGSVFLPGIASVAEGLAEITAGNHAEGIQSLGDGLVGIMDGFQQMTTGDADSTFQDSLDSWAGNFEQLGTMTDLALGNMGLAWNTWMFNINQGWEQWILDLRISFTQGMADLLGGLPEWAQNNIPGMDITIASFDAQLAGLQLQRDLADQAGRISNLYNNNQASADFSNPNSIAASTLGGEQATEIIPQLSPTTMARARADVEAQLTEAFASGDEAAIEVLTPIAANLEMDTDAIQLQATGTIVDTVEQASYNATIEVDVVLSAAGIDARLLNAQLQSSLSGVTSIDAGNGNSLEAFHTGGVFHAPPGETEGLALLREGETILTAGQQASANQQNPASGGNNITINSYGESPRSVARMVQRANAESGYGYR